MTRFDSLFLSMNHEEESCRDSYVIWMHKIGAVEKHELHTYLKRTQVCPEGILIDDMVS